MQLEEFMDLLTNFGEIQFLYMGKQYMASSFWKKPIFRKGHVEYWLFLPPNDSNDSQNFTDINDFLNYNICGRNIKDILDEIEVLNIY